MAVVTLVEAVAVSTAAVVEAAFTAVEDSTVAATAVAIMVAAGTTADLTAAPTGATVRSVECVAGRQCVVPARPGVGLLTAAAVLVTPPPGGIRSQDQDTTKA
jgi:hypothetical protein